MTAWNAAHKASKSKWVLVFWHSQPHRHRSGPNKCFGGSRRLTDRFCQCRCCRKLQFATDQPAGVPIMNVFRTAKQIRPFMLLFIPVAFVLGYVMQNFLATGAWLWLHGALGWLLRCRNCGMSIYFDKNSPYKTLLARPHRQCTNCGTRFPE